MAIYRYVYGFSIQRAKKVIVGILLGSFLLGFLSIGSQTSEDLAIVIAILLCMVVFYVSVPRKRVRQMLYIIPVLATGAVPIAMMGIFLSIFTMKSIHIESVIERIGDIFIWALLFLLYHVERRYYFTKCIGRNERFSIFITSAFILIIYMFFLEGDVTSIFGAYTSIIVMSIWLGLSLLLWFMIKIIIKETYAQYYRETSKTNERIIEIEMQHFEAYKRNQEEIRKLRHDMKNHLSCIKILLDTGEEQEAKVYLEEMMETVSSCASSVQTNVDIVDAIIDLKCQEAELFGIAIEVEGELPCMRKIKVIDWCKLFANAIDNGIEALKEIQAEEKKVLQIKIRKSHNFVLLQFENCCKRPVDIKKGKINSHKKDKENHGFGLRSIESAVTRYGGEINLSCEEKEENWCFILEILIPIYEEDNSSHISYNWSPKQ